MPELSATTRSLMSEVGKLRKRKAAAEAAQRKAMFQLQDVTTKTVPRDPPPAYKSKRAPSSIELDEWDKYNLLELLRSHDKDNTGRLPRDELRACVLEMEDHGRTVLSEIQDGKDSLDRLVDALDTNTNEKGCIHDAVEAS